MPGAGLCESRMTGTAIFHKTLVEKRRIRILARHFAALMPAKIRALDVGCGDGAIDSLITQLRPDVSIEGIDVLVRPDTRIPVRPFDGTHIPYADDSFDAVMFVDVLHHTIDPLVLLREAQRVAKVIFIKDHFCEGLFAAQTLRFMDWVGNAHHGVALPYNYWTRGQWKAAFDAFGVRPSREILSLGLYPAPASWVFERGLHFVAKLERAGISVESSARSAT
jgi:SAM-dependent methyltransferase